MIRRPLKNSSKLLLNSMLEVNQSPQLPNTSLFLVSIGTRLEILRALPMQSQSLVK